MKHEESIQVIDVRRIVKSPYNDYVRDHVAVLTYLLAPATYYESALQGGERDGAVLKLLNLADAVNLEIKQCLARRRTYWALLDRALWLFLAHSAPAARTLTPKMLDTLQKAILDREWYELMNPYQTVRQHVEQVLSIQHFPHQQR